MVNQVQGSNAAAQSMGMNAAEKISGGPDQKTRTTGGDPVSSQRQASVEALEASAQRTKSLAGTLKGSDRTELSGSGEEQSPEKSDPIAEERWEPLKNWQPDNRLTVEENLRQISKLFTDLQKEILSSCKGDTQVEMLEKLDELTLNAVTSLLEMKSGDLLQFIGAYGRPGSVNELVFNMFVQVALRFPMQSGGATVNGYLNTTSTLLNIGSALGDGSFDTAGGLLDVLGRSSAGANMASSGKSAARFGSAQARPGSGLLAGESSLGAGRFGPSGGAQARVAGNGVQMGGIYQRASSGGVQMDAAYQSSVRSVQKSLGEPGAAALKRLAASAGDGVSGSDLKKAQILVRDLKQNVFEISGAKLAYVNEEYLGFHAGVQSLKGQTLMDRMGKAMASVMRYAMDGFIQNSMVKNSQSVRQAAVMQNRQANVSFQAEDVQRTYHFLLKAYEETGNAQSAVIKGFQKAMELFQAKQANPAFHGATRYGVERGFFPQTAAGTDAAWAGWQGICKNWNQFLQDAGLWNTRNLRFDRIMDRNRYLAEIMFGRGDLDKKGIGRGIPYKLMWGMLGVGVAAGMGALLFSLPG
ncbi:MAG: hypothetical protein HFE84_12260 [Lachnospiraceae bacterium]|nr:hypothetical protein [Lachnospiraceae bacterium]